MGGGGAPGVGEFEEVRGLDAVADEVRQRSLLHGQLLAAPVDTVLPVRSGLLRVQLQRQVELVQLHTPRPVLCLHTRPHSLERVHIRSSQACDPR